MPPERSPPPALPAAPATAPRRSWWVLLLLLGVLVGGSQTASWWKQRSAAAEIRQLARHGDIVLFTTANCSYCIVASQWLNKHDVPWQECNIDTSSACLAQFQAKGAMGTPLVRVKTQWRLGFDPVWIGQALRS